jgi:hypothetical protein
MSLMISQEMVFPSVAAPKFKGMDKLDPILCFHFALTKFPKHSRIAPDAHSVAQASSSFDSTDCYRGDAQRFHSERDATIYHRSEAIEHHGQLELALEASQVALSAVEAEASTARSRLTESDARVVSKFFITFVLLTPLPC